MTETYQPEKVEERKSRNITMSDAAQWFGKLFAVGVAGGVAGWATGHALKGAGVKWANPKIFSAVGAKLAAIIKVFMMWQKGEGHRVGIQDMYHGLQDVSGRVRNNDDLQRDNALLEKMVAFEQEKQLALGAGSGEAVKVAQHEGHIVPLPQEISLIK